MNGEVRARYAKVPQKLVSITSMNGEVDLQVPSETKANVRLRTHNGSILTDFSEEVLKTKTENKGGHGYAYAYGADASAKAAADAARAAVHIAHEVAAEVQRAIEEEDDSDDEAPVPPVAPVVGTPDSPDVHVSPAPAPHSHPARAPKAPRPPRAPRSPVPPITGGKVITGTLNGGGVDIKISTMNGEIKLRQSQ